MTYREYKEKMKSLNEEDWVSDLYVQDELGDRHNLISSFRGISEKDLSRSLRQRLNDAEVKYSHRSGPYNSAYAHQVTLDFTVKSILFTRTMKVILPDDSATYSRKVEELTW